MADGDELPPVVAVLVGDDQSFLAMLERDVARVQEFRAEMEAALSGAGTVGAGVETSAGATAMGEQAAVSAQGAAAAFEGMALSVEETLALLDEDGSVMFEQLGATARTAAAVVEQETVGLGEVVEQLTAEVESGAMSAAAAMRILSGAEIDTNAETVTLSKSIATLRGTWAQATAAAEAAGTSEAQLGATSAILTDSQAALSDANTALALAYQQVAAGAELNHHTIDNLNTVLQEQADAQKQVVTSTQAMIDAETQVNAALLRDQNAFMDDAVAMRDMQAAAEMLGVELVDLEANLNAASYLTLNKAAADAKAQLSSMQLAEAQQQLAAANLTLVGTFQRLAEGEAVSAEAQAAALAGVSKAAGAVKGLGGATGDVRNLGSAAKGTAGDMGMLGSVMYGPVGMGAFMLMSLLPMLGGMFKSNAVSASIFTQAVSQDSNAIGDNTAATIQKTLAASNLTEISNQLGLSQAQLIEYAAGEKDVQDKVTAAYDAKQTAIDNTKGGTQKLGEITKVSAESGKNEANALYLQKQALDAVTGAVQQAVQQDTANSEALLAAEQTTQIYNASVNALGDSMLLQTQQTQMSNQATVEYGDRLLAAQSTQQYMTAAIGAAGVQMEISAHNTLLANEATAQYGDQLLTTVSSQEYMDAAVGAAGVQMELSANSTEIANLATVQYGDAVMGAYRDSIMFNAALDASYMNMQMQAQASSLASVGLLNLGDSQSQVNRDLQYSEQSYSEAQQGAQAYNTALSALNGSTNTLLGSEAGFTTSLGGLKQALDQNGRSLDVNNVKGAANIQTMTQIATSAQQAAVAVYQNDVATGRASQAYADANTKLAQEKAAFIAAADKAGYNKQQVQALANELFKLPPKIAVDVAVSADTSSAVNSLDNLYAQIDQLEGAGSTLANSLDITAAKEGAKGRASGGPVNAGELYHINEQGQEGFFIPPANGYVVPHNAMASLASGGAGGGGSPQVNVHVYLNGAEISAELRSEVQQYATHNSTTGFG